MVGGDDGGRYDKRQEGVVSITVGNNGYERLGTGRTLPILLAPCDARGSLLGRVRNVSILALARLLMRCWPVALARGGLTWIETACCEKSVNAYAYKLQYRAPS